MSNPAASFGGVDATTVNDDGHGDPFIEKAGKPMSSVSIIGLGNMAAALAGRALAGGHAVEVIGRDQAKAKELAATLGGGATVGTYGAAPAGDLVILAVPYSGAAAVVGAYGDALDGKIVIDVTNPVAPDFKSLVTPEGSSGAQELAKALPAGTRVVKAFNTLFSHVLAVGGPAEGRLLDVFIAADDAEAKALVSAFVESLGLRPMDVGELSISPALDNIAVLQLGLVANTVKHADFYIGISILG
jgi:hypothetical protein